VAGKLYFLDYIKSIPDAPFAPCVVPPPKKNFFFPAMVCFGAFPERGGLIVLSILVYYVLTCLVPVVSPI
jgi:hypothetical protein